jgi:hypothetical protein
VASVDGNVLFPNSNVAPVNDTYRAIEHLKEAARQAGVRRDDPLAPLVITFIRTIKALAEQASRFERATTEASQQISDSVIQCSTLVWEEKEQLYEKVKHAEVETVGRIANDIVSATEHVWKQRAAGNNRRIKIVSGLMLVATAAASFVEGCVWTERGGRLAIYRDVQAEPSTPADAYLWRQLMEWNDISKAISACRSHEPEKTQDGRRWCNLPVWLEGRPDDRVYSK